MEGPRKFVFRRWWLLLRSGATVVRSLRAHLQAWVHLESACRARTWLEAPSSSRSVCDRTPRTNCGWEKTMVGLRCCLFSKILSKNNICLYQATTDKLSKSSLHYCPVLHIVFCSSSHYVSVVNCDLILYFLSPYTASRWSLMQLSSSETSCRHSKWFDCEPFSCVFNVKLHDGSSRALA